MTTPSKAAMKAGIVIDVAEGGSITLHPSKETRTIVVRVLEKSGRRTKLRVQSDEAVEVSREVATTHA